MPKLKVMKAGRIPGVLFCSVLIFTCCEKIEHVSLWERHCSSCHDGKTVLNGKVVESIEQLKARYRSLDEFSNACAGSSSGVCMNILKHDKKLFREVGKEIGIGAPSTP